MEFLNEVLCEVHDGSSGILIEINKTIDNDFTASRADQISSSGLKESV